jgi:hypothetical protein
VQSRIKYRVWAAVVVGAVAVTLVLAALRRSPARVQRRSVEPSAATEEAPPAAASDAWSHRSALALAPTPVPAPDRHEGKPSAASQLGRRAAAAYDERNLDQMADDWEREPDDPERTLNIRTFIGAMVDTFGDAQGTWPASLEVRCRTSVCRIDTDGQDIETLRKLVASARDQQANVQFRMHEGRPGFEAYVGKEPAPPANSPEAPAP